MIETRGWEVQLGANVQWGASDHELFYNDVDTLTLEAYAVKADPFSGSAQQLSGSVFMVSPKIEAINYPYIFPLPNFLPKKVYFGPCIYYTRTKVNLYYPLYIPIFFGKQDYPFLFYSYSS